MSKIASLMCVATLLAAAGCSAPPTGAENDPPAAPSARPNDSRRTLMVSVDKALAGSDGALVGQTLMVCAPPPTGPRPLRVKMVFCSDQNQRCSALVSASDAELSLILPVLDPERPLRAERTAADCG